MSDDPLPAPPDETTDGPATARSRPDTLPEPAATATVTVVSAPRTSAAPGAVAVPGYEILGEFGRGGMGVVYRARQLKLNRIVALKMLLSGAHADPRELVRFLGEGEAVAAVKHPHVVQVYDVGESDGRPFLALECLEGGSLSGHLRTAGKLGPRDAAELVMKIALGVQAAHDHGIVHRDLKPHNVLFDRPADPAAGRGEPKVVDFGIMKHGASDLTQTGTVLGTPAYMAPEQARGETRIVGPAADIYSLGVILYECLTGTVPFTGPDAWSVIRRVISDEPEPAARRAPGVPRDLDLICRKCLAKEPAKRYASAAALADDLGRFLAGERPRGARTGPWCAARGTAARWWRPALAAVALGAAVAGAWAVFGPKKEDPLVTLRREEVVRWVEAMRRGPPAPDREPPHPVATLPNLPAPDLSAFQVLTDERTVDMRDWRPLAPGAPDRPCSCSVVYQTRRQLMKIAPANELRAEMRTSSGELFMRPIQPDPKRVRAFAAAAPGYVGTRPMKVRQLAFDVSDVPVNGDFALQFASTYTNSLQSPEEQWFGVIGYEGSFKISMLMLFPADRPFHEYRLSVAPTHSGVPAKQEGPSPYTGPVITFAGDDRSWLYWEIPNPKANTVYRVDWTW